VVVFDYDASNGSLTQKQNHLNPTQRFCWHQLSLRNPHIPDSKFIYGANRLHDSIAYFSIGEDGKLTYVGEEWTHGDYPRSFTIDPSGDFLYCCNQQADSITTFRINKANGRSHFYR